MKNQTIQFRVSEEEKALIANRAMNEGLTLSDYCRTVLTGFVIRLSPNTPTISLPLNPPPSPKKLQSTSPEKSLESPPTALPRKLLDELKIVLTKYYVE